METLIVTVDGKEYSIGEDGDFRNCQEFLCWRLWNVGDSQVAKELDFSSRQDFYENLFDSLNKDPYFVDEQVKNYYQGRYISNETY